MPTGYFYKWEDNNHGLEHKCGTCKTVLSSPRAKKTCLGIHEEVCTRYHKTMFFLGQSHHCDACHTTDESHDKRHREILNFVQAIRKEDGLLLESSPLPGRKKERTTNVKSRKGLIPLPDGPDDADEDQEDDEEDWNDSSTLNEDEVDPQRQHVAEDVDTKAHKKAAKAERKTAKHQARVQVITQRDLRELNDALHPGQAMLAEQKRQDASQGLDHQTIENNIAFNTNTFKYGSLRTDVLSKRYMKLNKPQRGNPPMETPEQIKALVDSILKRLGLNPNVAGGSTTTRKSLDVKIRTAIYKDLVDVENETAETMQRMAGYWRYASRRTYNAMVRMNEIWDWTTGAKLAEIEEEGELSDILEDESEDTLDGSTIGSATGAESPLSEVESYDDGDFELSDEVTTLKLRYLVTETNANEDVDNAKTPTQTSYDPTTPTQASVLRDRAARVVYSEDDDAGLLTYSPGRLPGPTLTFSVPSPSSSDEFWDGPDAILEANEGTSISWSAVNSEKPRGNSVSDPAVNRVLFSTSLGKKTAIKGNVAFGDEKDTRFSDKATRLASPTYNTSSVDENKVKHPKSKWSTLSKQEKEALKAKDLNNRFRGLQIETAAPNEEIELDDAQSTHAGPATIKRVLPRSSSIPIAPRSKDFPALPAAPKPAAPSPPKTKVLIITAEAAKSVEAKSKPKLKLVNKTANKTPLKSALPKSKTSTAPVARAVGPSRGALGRDSMPRSATLLNNAADESKGGAWTEVVKGGKRH